ncbi:VOC family protein [Marinilactibacillus piezotolerans]|uniref:VOC family protein n=1 Tax=Marinilactibacillus piezotolerans TaxID=258723 RepID=UPI0009AFE520|nr:VOC family protein [Marinilactibacillus piezotolerans]
MISKLAQVMLYVEDQAAAVTFWTEVMGFEIISKNKNDPSSEEEMKWIEIAPESDSATTLVLFDKKAIAEQSPELNLSTPSLMFFTEDLESLHNKLKQEPDIFVGEIVEYADYNERLFNFSDREENYFAVLEKMKN